MDPLPNLSKGILLVIQEEHQRAIGHRVLLMDSSTLSDSNSPTFAVATQFTQKPKQERPLCTHCGLQGHTIEKCYKLHGYPLGYEAKLNPTQTKAQVNQTTMSITENSRSAPAHSSLSSLTPNQCQQLIALLSSQLHDSAYATCNLEQSGPSISSFSGPYTGKSDWDG